MQHIVVLSGIGFLLLAACLNMCFSSHRHARRPFPIPQDAALNADEHPLPDESPVALDRLLMNDPAGIYPRMTKASRFHLCAQAASFSLHTGVHSMDAVELALALSQAAGTASLEAYVGYWFQTAKGLQALRRAAGSRKGWLYVHLAERTDFLRYGLLWLGGVTVGFLFLEAGNPVFMLPFFTLCAGSILRHFVNRLTDQPLPQMEIDDITPELRTLVVLPCRLHSVQASITAVHHMQKASQILPMQNVDYLLLGDFGESITAVSNGDSMLIQAAFDAVMTLKPVATFHYLQRGRTYCPGRHIYCARGGTMGAVQEVCRLITHGECMDPIAYAKFQPSQLERHYAYVLVLPESIPPARGMLETLLSVMTHPLNTRYPDGFGWRGYTVISPENASIYSAAELLRPDAFLEATDGLVDPYCASAALSKELAGHASVLVARTIEGPRPRLWPQVFDRSESAWRIASWQLPWVNTPAGFLSNPLPFFARFRLREQLRASLIPAARCVLLIWAVLTHQWLLLLVFLALPEILALPKSMKGWRHAACKLSLLPTEAAVSLCGMIAPLLRKASFSPNWSVLEIWVQIIAAAMMAALGIGIRAMTIPCLLLALVFACFPLAHSMDQESTQT